MSVGPIRILSDAEDDLDKGRNFYSQQGQSIGDYFYDSLLADSESLCIYAGVHAQEFGFYRMLAKRFPYGIYYDFDGDIVTVIAILPMRSNPLSIATKMSRKSPPAASYD